MYRWLKGIIGALLVLFCCSSEANAGGGQLYMQGWHLYRQGAYTKAIQVLRRARRTSDSPAITYLLSQSYIRLGDRFGRKGDTVRQKLMYQRALAADPMLVYNESFMYKYRALTKAAPSAPTPQATPPEPPPLPQMTPELKASKPSAPKKRAQSPEEEYRAKRRKIKQLKREMKRLKRKMRRSKEWRRRHRPRWDRWFGVGLTLGVDGVLGVQANLMLWGFFNFSATFSPFFQTFDGSMKLMILPFKWTPYVGTGFVFSFNPEFCDYNFIHVDFGVMFTASNGFTLTMGFTVPLQRDRWSNEYRSFAVPVIPTIQWAWYF